MNLKVNPSGPRALLLPQPQAASLISLEENGSSRSDISKSDKVFEPTVCKKWAIVDIVLKFIFIELEDMINYERWICN